LWLNNFSFIIVLIYKGIGPWKATSFHVQLAQGHNLGLNVRGRGVQVSSGKNK
jgi:hypothetical protein